MRGGIFSEIHDFKSFPVFHLTFAPSFLMEENFVLSAFYIFHCLLFSTNEKFFQAFYTFRSLHLRFHTASLQNAQTGEPFVAMLTVNTKSRLKNPFRVKGIRVDWDIFSYLSYHPSCVYLLRLTDSRWVGIARHGIKIGRFRFLGGRRSPD